MNYLQESARTAATVLHADKVNLDYLLSAVGDFNDHGAYLDTIKKCLFYGRDPLKHTLDISYNIPARLDGLTTDMLHGILGIATEASELTEALEHSLLTGDELDTGKVVDECGDLLWYMAMVLRVVGKDFDEVMERNINKLKLRFPDKFTTELANSKDHSVEQMAFKGV